MEYQVYDKAKWHWGAKNAPENLPMENGGTHTAFFLRWCIENNFYSNELEEDFYDEIKQIKEGLFDCRTFFMDYLDGVLTSEDLSEEGALFAHEYYSDGDTEFAKIFAWYLVDYGELLESNLFGVNDYFFVSFNDANYKKVKDFLDKRYEEFLQFKLNLTKK